MLKGWFTSTTSSSYYGLEVGWLKGQANLYVHLTVEKKVLMNSFRSPCLQISSHQAEADTFTSQTLCRFDRKNEKMDQYFLPLDLEGNKQEAKHLTEAVAELEMFPWGFWVERRGVA